MHAALPQTYTPENLAIWITENAIDKRVHTDEVPLDDKSRQEYKDKIAFSTAAIYDLKGIEKSFKDALNNGTTYNGQERLPQGFTIPPTKGLKELESNREHADTVLKKGFTEMNTDLFGIPYSAEKKIVFFNSEGKEYFDENMTDEQMENFGKPLFDGDPLKPLKTTVNDLKKKGVTVSMHADGKKLFDSADKPKKKTRESAAGERAVDNWEPGGNDSVANLFGE